MTDISNSSAWKELDSDNTNAAPDGVQGGYAPSTIAPVIRAIRGAMRRNFVRSNPIYVSTGSATAYALTYEGAPSSYATDEIYRFRAHIDNTGAATININTLGAKALISQHGTALSAGQIKAGRVVEAVYNGTAFELLSNEVHDPKFTGTLTANTIVATSINGIPTANIVASTREIVAGNGLVGGGDLSANRTISIGTPSAITANTVNSVSGNTHTHELVIGDVLTGNGLSGGGDLSADRTLSVVFGTSANTAVEGNDTRVVNATSRAGDAVTGGFTAASKNLGNVNTAITISPVGGNLQNMVNTGALTINAPTASGVYTIVVEVTNSATSGAVTLSGFTITDGDSFTTTSTHKFQVFITKTASFVSAIIKALQ